MKLFARKNGPESLPWNQEAEQALKSVPFAVRPMVRGKVEQSVRERGGAKVSLADFREAEQRFKAMDSLKGKMPAANEPGVPMLSFNACRNALAGCRNPLIDTEDWIRAIRDWAEAAGISEMLRLKVKADVIKFHNKVKVSVSGCPNGCSRPQISDLAVVGYARPEFNLDDCVGCGECAESCPDKAIRMQGDRPVHDRRACQGCLSCSRACPAGCISVEEKGGRLLAGGKLGRHPHLARVVGEFSKPRDAMPVIDKIVRDYLNHGLENERFADFWIRWNRRE